MPKTFVLDKILAEGNSYRTHPRVAYLIQKIGTGATSAVHLTVNNVALGDIIEDVAPLHKENTKINGLLDLGNLPYVIPPDTDFQVEGASGAKIRVVGTIYLLEVGEAIPSNIATRFKEQGNHYLKYVSNSYSFGAATSWDAGNEVTLYTLTPATIETYKFNNLLMINYSGFTANPGDVAIQIYVDNTPVEYLESDNLPGGIDLLSIPHQDDVAVNEDVFSLKNYPVEVGGDHTLKITAKNVSGSAISLSSASITLYAVAEYIRKP